MSPELMAIFAQFGPLGLMIGYLMWRETVANGKREALEKERLEVQRERTESDKALAMALTALTVTIQHLEQRIK
jgi:hypothetical protein